MLGTELKAVRRDAKMTQADFAAEIGVTREHLGRMERGETPISDRTLGALRLRGLRSAAPTRPMTSDPMERMVERALIDAGIAYVTDRDGRNESRLDFRLIDYDVEIEVKRFHSPRIADQMARADNVIAIQGEPAIRFFCDVLRGTAGAAQMLSAEAPLPPDAGRGRTPAPGGGGTVASGLSSGIHASPAKGSAKHRDPGPATSGDRTRRGNADARRAGKTG